MGAQQMKPGNHQFVLHRDKQQYLSLGKISNESSKGVKQKVMNQIHGETLTSERNLSLISHPKQSATVADFAKIKPEPRSVNENFNDQTALQLNDNIQGEPLKKKVKCELVDIFTRIKESSEADVNTTAAVEDCLEVNPILKATTKIDVKRELLQTSDVENRLKAVKQANDTSQTITDLTKSVDSNSESINQISSIIKTEITDAQLSNKHVKFEYINIFGTTVESLEAEVNNGVHVAEEARLEFNELLEPHDVENSLDTATPKINVTLQNNDVLELSDDSDNESSNEIYLTIKTERTDDIKLKENVKNKSFRNTDDKNNNHQLTKCTQLVKNPLAFLWNKRNKVLIKDPNIRNENTTQENFLNNTIKSAPQLEAASPSRKSPSSKNNESKIVLKAAAEESSICISELTIKSENLTISEANQDIYKSSYSNQNCLSYHDSSSLDVNLSNEDTDFEEALSKQSIEDSKYFSIIEISSEENVELPVQKSQLQKNIETPKAQKPHRNNVRKQRMRKTRSKKLFKTVEKPKTKNNRSKKHCAKDSAYKLKLSKETILKNLPKTHIKTRKKVYKPIAKKTTNSSKAAFPAPFKLEPSLELPKPIMFKSEFGAVNIRNKKSYLKPEWQPYVRLKRIKSEELLVPIKTKRLGRARKFKSTTNIDHQQMTSEGRHDFLIQRAYSLNTCTKLNRLSIDHDHYYCNEQRSFSNHPTSSYSRLTNTPNESLNETESKYYSPQELCSLFHSSTPNASSMLSGPLDSGVSTSTPRLSHHSSEHNKTLLLEVAAERAFINNHLIHFGYSPIQFDLYNNLNDLTVFLKYLFGNLNAN